MGLCPKNAILKIKIEFLKILHSPLYWGTPNQFFANNFFLVGFRQMDPMARFEDTRKTRLYESTELKKVNFSLSYVIFKKNRENFEKFCKKLLHQKRPLRRRASEKVNITKFLAPPKRIDCFFSFSGGTILARDRKIPKSTFFLDF